MRRLLVSLAILLFGVSAHAQQQVIFSEVMYNPAPGKPEFIEIWNISNTPLDIEKWKFSAGIEFQFPNFSTGATSAHLLLPQQRILVSAADAATTRAAYPGIPAATRIFGPWSATKALDNKSDTVTLEDRNGVKVVSLQYEDAGHWPIASDGAGHSLVLINENRDVDDWRNWRQSVNTGGSPGLAEPAALTPGLALSEIHFSPTTGRVDWVELQNLSTATTSADGLFLSGTTSLANKTALSGSVPAGGYVSFNVDFATDGSGDVKIFLVTAANQVRSALKVRRVAGRESWQIFPSGSSELYTSPTPTRDAANDPPRTTDIVINEIMLDPPSNQRDGEFIELYNRGSTAVNLTGWRLDEAVSFAFPSGTVIPPGGYLVIGANRAYLNSVYSGLTALGDWSGSLRNGGELIRVLDEFGNLAIEVDYRVGGEWPEAAGGNGSSLELVHPNADGRFGTAWQDSDESTKSSFETFTINGGTYAKGVGNGAPSPNDDEIRLWAVSDTHLVLRNIVMRPTAGGGNVFVNPEVTTLNNNNVDGWQSRGTHWASFHDAEGVHLVADGHGDNKCNHMEKDAVAMQGNTQYTLTFEARWVSGKPRLVAQSWDTSWGGIVRLPIPANLGTPGAANSRRVANAPAQLTRLLHNPPVPSLSQNVTVTARIESATPLSAVQVIHRKDSIGANATWNTTAMNDTGTAGDAVAGDGIWSAQITPGSFLYNASGNYTAEFYVRATTADGVVSTLPRDGAARPGLWTTDNQNPGSDLRRMRMVVSEYWLDALNQTSATGGHTAKFNFKYPRLANRYFPCTFISNDSEIYYGATVRKTGSPFTRQTDHTLARGRVTLPGDQLFRGKNRLYWDNDAGTTMLHNRITRYWLYLLGVPGNQNEVCRVTRNRDSYSVRETNEVFDKDMLNRIWENGSAGQFFELDDKFWIGDDGATLRGNQDGTWGYKGVDARGYDNPTFYHNQDIPKSREVEYDYGGFIEWTKQLQNTSISQEQAERLADTQSMTALAAVRGYIGDWDNLTIRRGKNGYMYQRSTDRKWMLIQWDSDLAFQNTGEQVLGSLAGVGTYFNRPFIRRYLNHYLTELLNTYPANGARMQAWLTAEENVSNAYSANSGTYTSWSTGRAATIQSFIGASLNSLFSAFTPANNSTTTTATVNVSGTAPANVFQVICVDHPEATLTWGGPSGTDVSGWTLSGIRLKTGLNNLIFRRLNSSGVTVGADFAYNITKSGNAPPSMALVADPATFNVRIGNVLTLDASQSFDPDGGELTYNWTIAPNTGVSMATPVPGQALAAFSRPGIYVATVQAIAPSGAVGTITREILAYNSPDFEGFGSPTVGTTLTVAGTELLDNYSPNSWYSLTENPNHLSLQVTDVSALPLNNPPAFPRLTRPLTGALDFVLQTDFKFETRFTGAFFTGLLVETLESGVPVKYAFGVDGGTALILRRAIGNAAFAVVGSSQPFPGTGASGVGATLRVRRAGSSLSFQRRVNNVWSTLTSVNLPAGSTSVTGGIFTTTSQTQSVRVAYDYLALANPGFTGDLISSLRITEIMYHPAQGNVEYLELQNIGPAAIDLAGAYFEAGKPFDAFTFPTLVLAPGEHCVVTNDSSGFRARYGSGPIIAGQYTGSLDNAGEEIHLRDSAGNTILRFTYDDEGSWPLAADGGGRSLEIRNPGGNSAYYSNGANWLPGNEEGGSPGYVGFARDIDGDGQSDAFELAFGSNPVSAGSLGGLETPTRGSNGQVSLVWTSVAGRTYVVEFRSDLTAGDWQLLTTVTASGSTTNYLDTAAPTAPERFYRVRTNVP